MMMFEEFNTDGGIYNNNNSDPLGTSKTLLAFTSISKQTSFSTDFNFVYNKSEGDDVFVINSKSTRTDRILTDPDRTARTTAKTDLPEDLIAQRERLAEYNKPLDPEIPKFILVPASNQSQQQAAAGGTQYLCDYKSTDHEHSDQTRSAPILKQDDCSYPTTATSRVLLAHKATEATHTSGKRILIPAQIQRHAIVNNYTDAILDTVGLPELQYSVSFNSKSTKSKSTLSCLDQDYSEEHRLLLLSSQFGGEFEATNHPQNNRSDIKPVPSQQVSTFKSYNSNICKNSTMNNISAHSNLGELLNAMKKSEKAKRDAEAAATLGEGINNIDRHSLRGKGVTMANTNTSIPSSLAKPAAIMHREKAKTTGMLTHQNPYDDDQIQTTRSGSLLPHHIDIPQKVPIPQAQFQAASIDFSQTSMNPFEDPALIADLQNHHNPTSMVQSPNRHSITFPVDNSDDPFAFFDPLQDPSQLQQQKPHHQPSPSIDTAQLSELAAALSSLKPQRQVDEGVNIMNSDHQVTLGQIPKDSTGTSKSHRRFLSLRGPKSLTGDEMNLLMESVPADGVFEGRNEKFEEGSNHVTDTKEKRHKRASSMGIFKRNSYDNNEVGNSSRPNTPRQSILSPKADQDDDGLGDGKFPGRRMAGKSPGRMKRSLRMGKTHCRSNSANELATGDFSPDHSSSRGDKLQLETIESHESENDKRLNAELSGSTRTEIKIRSSEHDPSPHQTSIPSVCDVLLQARLCNLLEAYREIDQNFDFTVLSNVSRNDMEMFIDRKTKSPSRSSIGADNIMQQTLPSISPAPSTSLLSLVPAHKPIVNYILSAGNDLVVSDFYYEVLQNEIRASSIHDTAQEKSPGDRTEVAIFESDELRQFIVVYQGSSDNQTKPIRNRIGKFKTKAEKNFGDEEMVTVYPPFEQGYSESGLEERVFQKLDALSEQHPFFDVIMTGHSYGAMLALLASTRYACSRPAIMVSCFAFGCPKVGALDFRHYVNALPNLKVMRFEYGFDPWVHAPDNPTWTHAGHTISILPQSKERKTGNEKAGKENMQNDANDFSVRAYKFGNDRPNSASSGKFIGKKGNRQEKQIDHDISSYLTAIEMVAQDRLSWPREFVGEEGSGVQGSNSEKRLVC